MGNARGDITRAKIIALLRKHALAMAYIANTLMLTESAVLYHLRILDKEGVVKLYRQGRQIIAEIRDDADFKKYQPFLNVANNVIPTKNEATGKVEKRRERT